MKYKVAKIIPDNLIGTIVRGFEALWLVNEGVQVAVKYPSDKRWYLLKRSDLKSHCFFAQNTYGLINE